MGTKTHRLMNNAETQQSLLDLYDASRAVFLGESIKLPVILSVLRQVDARHLSQCLDAGLGIAAGHGHEGLRRMAECLSNFVAAHSFRFVGDRAGVEDQQVGRPSIVHDLITVLLQTVGEQRRFRLVQAAAECMQGGARSSGRHASIIGRRVHGRQGGAVVPCAPF